MSSNYHFFMSFSRPSTPRSSTMTHAAAGTSPRPAATAAMGESYRHNPYDAETARVTTMSPQCRATSPSMSSSRHSADGDLTPSPVPTTHNDINHYIHHQQYAPVDLCGTMSNDSVALDASINTGAGPKTLHPELLDRVHFVQYPKATPQLPQCTLPQHEMCRLFLGQLPYNVTEPQLIWLALELAEAPIFGVEFITKNGERTGCVHCYCYPEDAQRVIGAINHRVLIDDFGVWYATNDEQLSILRSHNETLHSAAQQRRRQQLKGRPFGAVSVDYAKSTFRPRGHQNGRNRTPTPPPVQYNHGNGAQLW